MNVFYVGVDNPISVAAAGVSSNDLKVSVTNGTARNTGRGQYDITVSNPGAVCNVTLSVEVLLHQHSLPYQENSKSQHISLIN